MAGLLDFLGFGGGQQPMQAQTSMQQPQQQGGLFSGRMSALNDPAIALPLAGALMQPGNLGANLGQGFALAGQGVATRKKLAKERAVENATAQYLEAQGADAGLVELAKSGAGAEALQLYTQAKKRNDLMTVGKNIYDPNTGQWIAAPAGMGGDETEYGLQPIYGQDAQGNTVFGQVSKSGTFKPLDMPEGFKPSTGADKVDLGTQWGIIDRRTGQITQYIPKDVAGEAAQGAVGKAQGEAQANLPSVVANAEQSLAIIKDLKTDPNRQWATGKSSTFNVLPGTGGYDYKQKVSQLKGKAFLEAYAGLKGTGAISEIEGIKAEQAVARLDTAQTEEGFMNALNDLEEVVTRGIDRAKQKAAGGLAAPSPQPVPQAAPQGGVVDYRDFFGGQ